MNSSLYIGATGMKGLAEGMQVTTNNLANVSTIGFKQQNILFSTLICQSQANMGEWWNNQENSRVAIGQVQQGVQVEAVRTIFTQGGLESTNTVSDLAINGKGFFQVSDGDKTYYTRAGDFRADNQGVWRTPSGYALMGYQLGADGSRGALAPVTIDTFATMPAKGTSAVSISANFPSGSDNCVDAENPYFSLLGQYDAASQQPLKNGSYNEAIPMTVYDQAGNPRQLTVYFDGAPSSGPTRYVEFVIADKLDYFDENGNPIEHEEGDGLLMSGVLEFDSSGNLRDISAFTPSSAGSKDLSTWTSAAFTDGLPTLELDGAPVTIDFGLRSTGASGGGTAADVGTSASLLPGMGESVASGSNQPCTAYGGSSSVSSYSQDGYSEGYISNISVANDGTITGYFSNNQSMDLWQIPLARFTSEDGLYREGGNLFSYTEAAGQMELGVATTENYGAIRSYNIESSNVDMAQEMVYMILTQRGFQSNSKVVTTADEMLRKAMELKR